MKEPIFKGLILKELFLKEGTLKDMSCHRIGLLVFVAIFLCGLSSCQFSREQRMNESYTVLVLFAHPDDETWVSGTLAKLADKGLEVIPVYATSGDKGSDRLELGLSGTKLAKMRELEAIKACEVLGVSPPIFLRFADGKLTHLQSQLSNKFKVIVERVNPTWVISFMQGGITGNRDHRIVSKLITRDHSTRAVYFGLSDTRARSLSRSAQKFGFNYTVTAPVDDNEVTHRVDVSQYTHLRTQAMSQHINQFPPVMINAFADFVSTSSFEELILTEELESTSELLNYLD